MSANARYGLEQARIQLPSIIANARAGIASIVTRHGKPVAAIVPLQDLQNSRAASGAASGLLELRSSGRGLWGADIGQTISRLRDEWVK
jgi:prevent-host-death family protein